MEQRRTQMNLSPGYGGRSDEDYVQSRAFLSEIFQRWLGCEGEFNEDRPNTSPWSYSTPLAPAIKQHENKTLNLKNRKFKRPVAQLIHCIATGLKTNSSKGENFQRDNGPRNKVATSYISIKLIQIYPKLGLCHQFSTMYPPSQDLKHKRFAIQDVSNRCVKR